MDGIGVKINSEGRHKKTLSSSMEKEQVKGLGSDPSWPLPKGITWASLPTSLTRGLLVCKMGTERTVPRKGE